MLTRRRALLLEAGLGCVVVHSGWLAQAVVVALTGPVLSLVVASGNSVNAEVTALLE